MLFTTILLAMICLSSKSFAQDCIAIVKPHLDRINCPVEEYPEQKLLWRCHMSYNTFYFTDTVAEGAVVFEFSALTNHLTDQHPQSNTVIDLEKWSYWAWDFDKFQFRAPNSTIYFDTHKSTNRYLACRPWNEAYRLTYEQEKQQ